MNMKEANELLKDVNRKATISLKDMEFKQLLIGRNEDGSPVYGTFRRGLSTIKQFKLFKYKSSVICFIIGGVIGSCLTFLIF